MSMSQVEKFWIRVATDSGYQSAFRSALPEQPSPAELAAFASEHGFDLRADDFLQHARTLTVSAAGALDRELSDEVLDSVAGGGSADSYASAPLEMDIYATWGDLPPSGPSKDALPGTAAPGTTAPPRV